MSLLYLFTCLLLDKSLPQLLLLVVVQYNNHKVLVYTVYDRVQVRFSFILVSTQSCLLHFLLRCRVWTEATASILRVLQWVTLSSSLFGCLLVYGKQHHLISTTGHQMCSFDSFNQLRVLYLISLCFKTLQRIQVVNWIVVHREFPRESGHRKDERGR